MSAFTLSSLTLAFAIQPASPEPTTTAHGAPTDPAQPAAPAENSATPTTSSQASSATVAVPTQPAQPNSAALPTQKAPPAAQSRPAAPVQPASPLHPPSSDGQSHVAPTQALKTSMRTAWGVGVSAGTTSGIGISARRHFENRLGVHFGGIYVYSDETHWGNLGGQLLYTLARSKKTRLYGLLGAQFVLNHSKELRYDFIGASRSVGVTNGTLFVGPGIGLEIHFTRHFGWALEVPTSFVFALEGDKDRLPLGGVVNFIPAANTSFTFYFR